VTPYVTKNALEPIPSATIFELSQSPHAVSCALRKLPGVCVERPQLVEGCGERPEVPTDLIQDTCRHTVEVRSALMYEAR
jgi:hypothetical protein